MTSVWTDLAARGLVRRDVALRGFTTYRFGGPARFFVELTTRAELDQVVDALGAEPVEALVVGRGSNLVISDDGFDGLVIKLAGKFLDIAIDGAHAHAGGAVSLPRLARAAAKEGRSGLEFLVGVPGSVGGAVTMNAGCFGSETAEWLVRAEIVDLATGRMRAPDPVGLQHGYRYSNVRSSELVVSAVFRTETGDRVASESKMREITQWRKETQPGGTFNAGSVFKNPDGDAAGRLIDEVGLKGLAVGGASVSERHANFFVADDAARAQDVFDLVATVRARVAAATGVELTPEIRFAGRFEATDVAEDPRYTGDGPPS